MALRLSTPAPSKWITGRIASMLAQYFQGDISEQMMKAIADDWQQELKVYPAWAIAKAVRWWMSSENKDRRKKPMAGDISDRARKEMGVVMLAQSSIRLFDSGSVAVIEQHEKERISAERAAELIAEAGFSVKKFS